jgi:hypothetical protein
MKKLIFPAKDLKITENKSNIGAGARSVDMGHVIEIA